MSDQAISKLNEYYDKNLRGDLLNDYVVVNSKMDYLLEDGTTQSSKTPGILAGLEVHPLYPHDTDE